MGASISPLIAPGPSLDIVVDGWLPPSRVLERSVWSGLAPGARALPLLLMDTSCHDTALPDRDHTMHQAI